MMLLVQFYLILSYDSADRVFLLHLKLALAGLRIANEEEPKVDFDGYFCLLYYNILLIVHTDFL